jgi:hypothetical protein
MKTDPSALPPYEGAIRCWKAPPVGAVTIDCYETGTWKVVLEGSAEAPTHHWQERSQKPQAHTKTSPGWTGSLPPSNGSDREAIPHLGWNRDPVLRRPPAIG